MACTKTALKSNEIFIVFVPLSRMVGHDIFLEGAAERQLLREGILEQRIGTSRILFPQIVYIDNQATRLFGHHRLDMARINALILLQIFNM